MRLIRKKRLRIKSIVKADVSIFNEIRQGIERECLRVDSQAQTSRKPHPISLGHKLTHKCITTDYAENLLEFITGVNSSTTDLIDELLAIHVETTKSLGDELLWCQSMPALLPEDSLIPLANYGDSNIGKLKTLYRKGLGLRYGRSMQSIAGIHYNFSLSDSFWENLKKSEKSDLSLMEFKNEKYFHLIRNYRRHSWILIYLFGATPVVDENFLVNKKHQLEKLTDGTFFTPHGISLRMGGLGYTSKAQEDISICYNQLDTYISTLEKARQSSYNPYTKIGLKGGQGEHLQLNDHLLQIDNEFYSNIRPKNLAKSRESALGALYNRGIEYIEVRLLDVNPYTPLGIDKHQINFLHLFLVWCLNSDSPKITKEECLQIDSNFDQIVKFGRKKSLKLVSENTEVPKQELLQQVFAEIEMSSESILVTDKDYRAAFDTQMLKIESVDNLLSTKVLEAAKSGFVKSTLAESLEAKEILLKIEDSKKMDFKKLAATSIQVEEQERLKDTRTFDEFLKVYFKDIKLPI